jgi:hypothetical protein
MPNAGKKSNKTGKKQRRLLFIDCIGLSQGGVAACMLVFSREPLNLRSFWFLHGFLASAASL